MKPTKERYLKAVPELAKTLGLKNVMAVPKLSKIVVSSGTGKAKDKKRNELVANRLTKILGQKPATRGAKQSIAGFKLRQGDVVGFSTTLRGERMYAFLDKLINVAFPRTRDFRGLSAKAIDDMGNMTIGVREHTIFPETADEDLKDVFGLAITLTTTAKDKKQARALLDILGIPFKKD